MKHRLDPLIAERAPWLFADRPGTAAVRHLLDRMLGYDKTCVLAQAFRDMPAGQIMTVMTRMLAQNVTVSGTENIPASGPALVVANHPTGIADGIILHKLLARHRPDVFYFANHDILRVLPQMNEIIAPVEWRRDKRSRAKTRETMAFTREAMEAGRLGVIFPSGRLAKRRGLGLHERPWMSSAAMIARKFDLPVIPVRMEARNSWLFYAFDALHPTLRDITLFHETLNKARQPYGVTIGAPIPARDLSRNSEDAIETLRSATLRLGDQPEILPLSRRDTARPSRARTRAAIAQPATAR